MQDIVIEIIRCIIVLGILGYLWSIGKRETLRTEKGWKIILLGFSFIAFGMILDITDNFQSLNKYIVIGDTIVESYLEKIVGYLLGFTLLAIGFKIWIPRVIENKKLKQALLDETNQLKMEVKIRKKEEELRIQSENKLYRAEKMKAVGLMAGGVAHDLNNILSAMVSYPDLILMKLPKEHEVTEEVIMIQESGKRAARIVSDLLTISRGIATVQEITNLNDLVSGYFQSPEYIELSSLYPEVSFKKYLDRDLANLFCSPVHISKCIMNIVTNGAEAISGEGVITITTRNVEIKDSQDGLKLKQGKYVHLSIADNGPGMPEKDIDSIFEPFYTRKTMGRSGTGLGLAIVWNTIQDHNGEIEVRSDNRGTIFDLYFPATDLTQEVSIQTRVTVSDLLGDQEHILVVDDEEPQREITCALLRRLNYEPTSVESGEKALEYVENNPVPLIILDMIMDPGMNGLTTYKKSLQKNPQQKAIIVSGYAEDDLVNKTQELGASKFLTKPFTIIQLGEAIKTSL